MYLGFIKYKLNAAISQICIVDSLGNKCLVGHDNAIQLFRIYSN